MATSGLVLGKFMPPHRGHQHLIDTARARVDRLTVMVCSLAREPIPGRLRWGWMRELYPDLDVVHVTDENPQEPHEHPDFWDIWVATVRRVLPAGPDYIFTSESYGDEMARRLGARHVAVDAARATVPISGTLIRSRPYEHWEYLPECVRPYFLRRVCVYGPESTGKTTLARDLAAHFGTVWVPEYARELLVALPCELADIPRIAQGQMRTEDELARQARGVLFCDTDLITTRVWSEYYFGECPEWICREADARRYDLYLLTCIDVPWVPDPQRDQPHTREYFQERFTRELQQRGRPYVPIRGSWEDRFHTACRAVEDLLRTPVSRIQ